MINVAIVGYGNVGRGVIAALGKNKDMKLTAVFSRRPEQVSKQFKGVPVLNAAKVAVPHSTNFQAGTRDISACGSDHLR